MVQDNVNASQPKEVRSQLTAWLLSDGWKLSDLTAPEAQWAVQAEDSGARKIVVAQMKIPSDQILIMGSVVISPNDKQQLEALPNDRQSALLWDLRFRLLLMNLEFNGVGEPLTNIDLLRRIYLEGLTKNSFIHQVFTVKNAVIAVLWSIAKELQTSNVPPGHAAPPIH